MATETVELAQVEKLKTELEQVKKERDGYKSAYEQISEQNANIWGLYSNLVDYVVAQTNRKQGK